MFFDSHAHLSSPEIGEDIHPILARAKKAGITTILNICTDFPSLERGLALSQTYPWVYQAAATTPHDVAIEGELFFPQVEALALKGQLVAIGETGLDYHYEHSPKEVQQFHLRKYLRLALKSQLPVVIHCREAFGDLFSILDEEFPIKKKGILHCFTGTEEEAKELVQRGWYISFSGIVTFKKSSALREVAKQVPLDQLLIETDAPFLAPQAHRGKRNEPAFLPETAKVIAHLKGITEEQLAISTTHNALSVLNLI